MSYEGPQNSQNPSVPFRPFSAFRGPSYLSTAASNPAGSSIMMKVLRLSKNCNRACFAFSYCARYWLRAPPAVQTPVCPRAHRAPATGTESFQTGPQIRGQQFTHRLRCGRRIGFATQICESAGYRPGS